MVPGIRKQQLPARCRSAWCSFAQAAGRLFGNGEHSPGSGKHGRQSKHDVRQQRTPLFFARSRRVGRASGAPRVRRRETEAQTGGTRPQAPGVEEGNAKESRQCQEPPCEPLPAAVICAHPSRLPEAAPAHASRFREDETFRRPSSPHRDHGSCFPAF